MIKHICSKHNNKKYSTHPSDKPSWEHLGRKWEQKNKMSDEYTGGIGFYGNKMRDEYTGGIGFYG